MVRTLTPSIYILYICFVLVISVIVCCYFCCVVSTLVPHNSNVMHWTLTEELFRILNIIKMAAKCTQLLICDGHIYFDKKRIEYKRRFSLFVIISLRIIAYFWYRYIFQWIKIIFELVEWELMFDRFQLLVL